MTNNPRQANNPRLRSQARHGSGQAHAASNNPRQRTSQRRSASRIPQTTNPRQNLTRTGVYDPNSAVRTSSGYGERVTVPAAEERVARDTYAAPVSGSPQGANNPRLRQQPRSGGYAAGTARPMQSPAQRSLSRYPQPGNRDAYTTRGRRAAAQEPFYNSGPANKRRRRPPIAAIVVAILAVVAVGVGVWWFLVPPAFTVTVNGVERQVTRGTTIDNLIDEGVVSPKAGDFMAIDQTLLEASGGYRFSGTVNGEATNDGARSLSPNDIVEIGDGADKTETYTTETLSVEPENTVQGIGAIHAYVDGTPGITEVKTGDVSGAVVKEVKSNVVNGGVINYNADTDDKVIALTFDDGPWPETTEQILDILEENGAKATFFTIGNQVSDHADQVKRAAAAGHQICTHSWDHADGSGQGVNLTYMTPEEQVEEIQKGFDVIKTVTGADASTVIRTPGGNFYGDLVWNIEPLASAEINWNIDTEDWRRPGVDSILAQILSAEPGDVVLMHDGGGDRSQTVAALRQALPQLVAQGYRFVTIDELMALSPPDQALQNLDEA